MTIQRIILLLLAAALLGGCGYNSIQSKDEAVTAAWSEVLTKVTEARASVGKVQLTVADLSDEAKVKQFQAAQGELSSALSRLMAVSENYPNLKADGLFQNLQAQLEGTENRIAVARNRYVTSVQDYNTFVRSFPQNLTAKMFGYKTKANFSVENEKAISVPPTVDFNKPAQPAPTKP